MKFVVITLACILVSLVSQAQWANSGVSDQRHFLYGSGEVIMGKQNAGKLGLNYVYNNKLTLSLGYAATAKTESALPAEFLKSANVPTPANYTTPYENSENLHLMVGRIFNLNRSNTIRVVLQGGPALSTNREANFTLVTDNMEKYTTNIEATKKLSFVMNPKVEFPLCCTIGVSAGPMLIVNDSEKYFGAGIGVMYGFIKRN